MRVIYIQTVNLSASYSEADSNRGDGWKNYEQRFSVQSAVDVI